MFNPTQATAGVSVLATTSQEERDRWLARVEAEGLDTVRFVFPDQHGILRGKTLMLRALRSAIETGITAPSTVLLKDTSQRTAFPVWGADAGFGHGTLTGSGDILLVPDLSTFRILPWSPKSGWVLCDVANVDGTPLPFAPRTVLKQAVQQLASAGYHMVAGLEVEFHIFELADPRKTPASGGMPAEAPDVAYLTRNNELLGEARYDALEQIIDQLRAHCVALDLPVRAVEAEFGPSQVEFVFDPAGPLERADAMVLFRSMVKQVCARQGLHATFMCQPKLNACAASGWHLHQSIVETATGQNIFVPRTANALPDLAGNWIAGLLEHAAESCLLTTPTVNGYRRYQPHQLAPNRIQWAHDNRGAMIRALVRSGDDASRIENRVAEPAANPYYAFASQILSGMSGLKRKLVAPEPVEAPYDDEATLLPSDLSSAITAFESGSLYRDAIGETFVDYYAHLKRAEWQRYISTISDWEQREYFSLL
ncbi:MAG: glutamine synthetase family protein [Pseudomonadota bacterium]